MRPRKTVLIVTDAEDIHSGVGWLLQKRGYRAIEVDCKSALGSVRQEAPGLILIDSDHSLSESLTLSRSLRTQSDLAHARVIILTSENQLNSRSGKTENASEYLIGRNDSAGIMKLLAELDTVRAEPLRRAHGA